LEHNFFWVGSPNSRKEGVPVKFWRALLWAVFIQPRLASIPEKFLDPCMRIAAPKGGKEL
jgi:hypothetical protein